MQKALFVRTIKPHPALKCTRCGQPATSVGRIHVTGTKRSIEGLLCDAHVEMVSSEQQRRIVR